jgi:hypothetical protein
MQRQPTTVELLHQRPFQAGFTTASTVKRTFDAFHSDMENEPPPVLNGVKPFQTIFVKASPARKRRVSASGELLYGKEGRGTPGGRSENQSPLPRRSETVLSQKPISPPKPPRPLTKLSLVEAFGLFVNYQAHRRWELPSTVVDAYASKGITDLYPWQEECLSLPGILSEGKNVVYTGAHDDNYKTDL